MVNAWKRLAGPSARRWRVEGKDARHFTGPNLAARIAANGRPTKLLFVNQYYWPDHASTAQHLTDLAESLAARGYECHVLCSRGSYKPGQPTLPARETHNGVQIHRVRATSLGRRSTLRRMADYLSFYVYAFLSALMLPRCDVVVTLTTPPIIGLIGTMLRRLKGSRHVYWSMDLHPDASIALGRMSPRNPVVRLLSWISDTVYRRADRVVVLGDYMSDRIARKGVRGSRLAQIPVWSRRDEIDPLPREGHPLRAELGLDDQFVVMYSGNLGIAHCFDEFMEAARRLRDRKDITFLFVGDGPRLREVREAKERDGLENVRLMSYFPRSQLRTSLSLADVHLISMRGEMTGIVVPGKLYGAMASGRPTLFVGPDHCESADTIRQARCGLTLRQGDAAGVVEAIEKLAADTEERRRLGRNARSAFLSTFEREQCCADWAWLIGELAGAPVPVPQTVPVPAAVSSAMPRSLSA